MSTTNPILLMRVFLGEQELQHLPTTRSKVILGRDPYSDVYLEDPRISRVHASVDWQDESNKYVLTDISANGTCVNGHHVKKIALSHGDMIELGRFRVLVELHDGTTENALEGGAPPEWDADIERTLRNG